MRQIKEELMDRLNAKKKKHWSIIPKAKAKKNQNESKKGKKRKKYCYVTFVLRR